MGQREDVIQGLKLLKAIWNFAFNFRFRSLVLFPFIVKNLINIHPMSSAKVSNVGDFLRNELFFFFWKE